MLEPRTKAPRRPSSNPANAGPRTGPSVLASLAATVVGILLLIQPATAQETGSVSGQLETHGESGVTLATARFPELALSASVAADGAFRFDAVPPGTYLLVVEIPSVGLTSESVTVSAGRETAVEAGASTTSPTPMRSSSPPPAISAASPSCRTRSPSSAGQTCNCEWARRSAKPSTENPASRRRPSSPVPAGRSSAVCPGRGVRVMTNGIGTGDASAVSADHAVTSEPAQAEQIEVLRGPATLPLRLRRHRRRREHHRRTHSNHGARPRR